MEIAKLKVRFRNEIRCRELNEYKQRVRNYFLEEEKGSLLAQHIEMDREIAFDRQGRVYTENQNRRMQEIIVDFQCNCSEVLREYDFDSQGEAELSDGYSNSSSMAEQMSTLPKHMLDYSLNDLELITFMCLRSEREGHLYFNTEQCLPMIASIFYVVMEKYIPMLLDQPNPFQCRLFTRLKRSWIICQRILLQRFIGKLREDKISSEQSIYVSTLIAQKIIYMYKCHLLSCRSLLYRNQHYFKLIFDQDLMADGDILHEMVTASYILIKSEEKLDLEGLDLGNFIHRSAAKLLDAIGMSKGEELDSEEYAQSVLLVLDMVYHCEDQQNWLTLLMLGIEIISFPTLERDLKVAMLIRLLWIIRDYKLYQQNSHYKLIDKICFQAVLADTKKMPLELWAMQILGKIEESGYQTLIMLKIHYTYSIITEQEKEYYQLYIKFIEHLLANSHHQQQAPYAL